MLFVLEVKVEVAEVKDESLIFIVIDASVPVCADSVPVLADSVNEETA